jgi:hypothetical protein
MAAVAGRCTSRSGTPRGRTAEGVGAGEVEVEEAAQLLVSAGRPSNITLSRNRSACTGPRGSAAPAATPASCLLEGQLVASRARRCTRPQVRQHQRHRVGPPGQAAQVGLLQSEVGTRQVHARQHRAHLGAVVQVRAPAGGCRAGGHQRGRLAASRCRIAPSASGLRHRAPGCRALRQVLHQAAGSRAAVRPSGARTPSAPSARGRRGVDEEVAVLDAARMPCRSVSSPTPEALGRARSASAEGETSVKTAIRRLRS